MNNISTSISFLLEWKYAWRLKSKWTAENISMQCQQRINIITQARQHNNDCIYYVHTHQNSLRLFRIFSTFTCSTLLQYLCIYLLGFFNFNLHLATFLLHIYCWLFVPCNLLRSVCKLSLALVFCVRFRTNISLTNTV